MLHRSFSFRGWPCVHWSIVVCTSVIVCLTAASTKAADKAARKPAEKKESKIDFQADVAPILQQNCVDCHGPELQMAGLRLDQRRFAVDEGEARGLITPGKSEDSLLILRLVDKDAGLIMPPTFPFFPGEKPGLAEKQIAILKRWIDEGADWPAGVDLAPDSKSAAADPRASALFAAIRAGDHRTTAGLPDDKSLAKATDKHGSTPLMYAALYSDADMLRLLIDRGADVNVVNKDGITALMWAAGDIDKVRLLLARGAKVDVRTEMGRTPLLIAATYTGNVEVVRLLLKSGGKPTDVDQFGETPLTSAAKRGDVPIVEALIEAGADVHAGGRPPLAWAAEEGNVETIAALLKQGAGENKNHLNQALFSAAVRGPTAAVKLLLEKGGDPGARAGFAGYTPLMGAAYSESKSTESVRLLLDKGADVKLKGANGETALSLAKKRGRTDVVKLLQKAGAME
ncbi:MAG: ankyrin repeat domain-containing protein [Deltaproteobacteria bacterium]